MHSFAVGATLLFLGLRLLGSFAFTPNRISGSISRSPKLSCNALASEQDIERIAILAASRAGEVILRESGKINLESEIFSKIGSRDIVTEVDRQAQTIIKEVIMEAFPSHKFLGEEDIEPGIEASSAATKDFISAENLWIVDPIDGTTNFAHGMPLSGVIIAYASKGETKFGVIYDPFRREFFTAWRGKGAFLNGKRISCCSTKELKDSVVSTGSPPNNFALEGCLRATNLISSKVRTVRMLGSAALMLSWVACGRLTAYFETDLNVWDLAAGALLIEESGGRVTDVWGQPYKLSTRNLVSSNGNIHGDLLGVLMEGKMWMPGDVHGAS